MGSLTDFLENKLLDHTFENTAYVPPATVYIALFTADPGESGSVVSEVSGNGYARKAIAFSAAANRKIIQNGQVTFPQCVGGGWGTITHWGIMSALTGGNMLAYGAFVSPIATVVGNVPFIADTITQITAQNGTISNYLAHAWLNFVFRNTPFAQPNINVGFASAAVLDTDDGSTVTELNGFGYARVDFNDWSNAIDGAVSNATDIDFPVPTGAWSIITHSFTIDSNVLGNGNILTYGQAQPNQAPQLYDPVRFVAGAYDISVN